MAAPRIVVEPHAPDSIREYVREQLDLFNVAVTGRSDWAPLTVLLRGEHDEIGGGLLGACWGGWLHVEILWVAEPLRRRGHGRALLEAAERWAIAHGCEHARLASFSFQAPGFYERHGWREFGRLDGFPPDHALHFFRKRLIRQEGEP